MLLINEQTARRMDGRTDENHFSVVLYAPKNFL